MSNYAEFLTRKSQIGHMAGFTPVWMPDFLFDFQRHLCEWSIRKGRAAIFADCGMGKAPMQLVCAENWVRKTGRPALILTPLAVSLQLVREAEKFGIEAHRSMDGKPQPNITVTNYERLDKFNPDDYCGAVLDEASIIKHWTGATQKAATRFLSKMHYRLLCTATPSPNDYVEMGTLSEALGELTHSDMLAVFFRQLRDDEKKNRATADDIIHSKRLSWRVIQSMGQWVLKPHAFEPFWKWVASWARACRKPSDLGDFKDADFVLPPLNRRDHTVIARTPPPGFLFTIPAFGLNQERGERQRTLEERSELVAELVKNHDCSIIWCQLNPEGDILEKMLPNALQVAGKHDLDYKEAVLEWFLGQKCLCNDKRFSDKIKSWQTQTGKPTTPLTTEPTQKSTSAAESNKTRSTPDAVSDTPPTPPTGKKSKLKSKHPSSGGRGQSSRSICEHTGSALPTTNGCLPNREDAALSADERILETSADTACTLITATQPGESEGCSALVAIRVSGNSETTPNVSTEQQCTCGHLSGKRILISKAKVAGLGLNLQHCAHVVTFVTHSYEQFYQCVRRCWRFGQKRPVTLDVIATEGEVNVRKNMDRKEKLASIMYDSIIQFMNDALAVKGEKNTLPVEVPSWLSKIS